MHLPSPNLLRQELEQKLAPGSHDPSVVQFGCEGCPTVHRFVASWLSVTKLVIMMDSEVDVPRCFVSGGFEAMGKAQACETDPETEEPICQHENALRTVISRVQPFPDL